MFTLLHHYLQKGIEPDEVLGKSNLTKLFYLASKDVALEDHHDNLESIIELLLPGRR
ncbi:hypothetical protein [Anaerosolibacter sp.]|uniref:hypothetical protein n=1 Tax=Anaerosolibacter sp. TaxID=1872527 RepID=UPI0026267430|nr:hypothetical protein [Anaerosolibacter sp.]